MTSSRLNQLPKPYIPYPSLPYPTLSYPTLPYSTPPYQTLPIPTLPYLTLPYPTLPYLTLTCPLSLSSSCLSLSLSLTLNPTGNVVELIVEVQLSRPGLPSEGEQRIVFYCLYVYHNSPDSGELQ